MTDAYEGAVEKILKEQQGEIVPGKSAEITATPLHICRARPNWRTELLVAINNAVNGMYPLQKIRVCCGGRARARRAAEIISRPLKKRKGVDNVNNVDLESDDDEDTGDYLVNIDMNG